MNYFVSKLESVNTLIKVENSDLEIISVNGSAMTMVLDCLENVNNQDIIDTLADSNNNKSITQLEYDNIKNIYLSNNDISSKKSLLIAEINTLRQQYEYNKPKL